jgi:hypothetical protein
LGFLHGGERPSHFVTSYDYDVRNHHPTDYMGCTALQSN